MRIPQVVKERKVLEVHINKGMRNGQKITFHGEADEAPGTVPGDIIFIIEEKVRRESETRARSVHFLAWGGSVSLVRKTTRTEEDKSVSPAPVERGSSRCSLECDVLFPPKK